MLNSGVYGLCQSFNVNNVLQMIIPVPTTSIHNACAIDGILKNGEVYGTNLSDR
jgi:hypothetical protein